MTKPNDFTLNTDYLPLAQTGKTEFTVYYPAETFSTGSTPVIRTQDFTVSPMQGAIDTYYMSLNNGDYVIGPYLPIERHDPYVHFTAFRVDATTIRVKLYVLGDYAMPAQTLKVKVVSFAPPNVF